MVARRKKRKYRLTEIDAFDARRGFKRCILEGVGVSFVGRRHTADADFWKDRTGRLVVRFSSQGYNLHFEASLASGKPIPENELNENDFGQYVADTLADWVIEGVDDLPNSIYET